MVTSYRISRPQYRIIGFIDRSHISRQEFETKQMTPLIQRNTGSDSQLNLTNAEIHGEIKAQILEIKTQDQKLGI